MQADRRRLNAPPGGTQPPIFSLPSSLPQPARTRPAEEHRKLFLQTGVVPSASGSAYYEVPPIPSIPQTTPTTYLTPRSSLKLTCTVHGPRPLPRTAAFSPNLLLTTHVKFAPFATRRRRGYVRDAGERDLSGHLETALRGAVIAERWPKAGLDVVVTVLEGEDEDSGEDFDGSGRGLKGWGTMNVLAGCITVACAALVDAGVDCVDLVSGGVAAVVAGKGGMGRVVVDPAAGEEAVRAACVVGYLHSRDEMTELWLKGEAGDLTEGLVEAAVKAATMTRSVLVEAVKEATELKMSRIAFAASNGEDVKTVAGNDIPMTG